MDCSLQQSSRTACPVYLLPFREREELIVRGLNSYLCGIAGEYFTDEQIDGLVDILKGFRYRSKDIDYSDKLCHAISTEDVIRNRFLPHKTLRKDELAILFYNLSPYALVSRNNMAKVAKSCFPNFFASVATINSTFTKYQYRQETRKGREVCLTISNLAERTTTDLESFLFELGLNQESE